MEWNRVKSIMIAVLFATCLILGINIARQVHQQHAREQQAVRDACEVALRKGTGIDSKLVLNMPESSAAQEAERDKEVEQQLADALLGTGCVPEEPGGGVSIYQNQNGRISIRRGGALEIELFLDQDASDDVNWTQLLEKAGLDLSFAEIIADDHETVFVQYTADEVEIVNCRLTCSAADGKAEIVGRWQLEQMILCAAEKCTRAELTLALSDAMQRNGATKVYALEQGYYLQSKSVRRLQLVPAWVAETDAGLITLNILTQKEMPGV